MLSYSIVVRTLEVFGKFCGAGDRREKMWGGVESWNERSRENAIYASHRRINLSPLSPQAALLLVWKGGGNVIRLLHFLKLGSTLVLAHAIEILGDAR
jgi:hypothetical protein